MPIKKPGKRPFAPWNQENKHLQKGGGKKHNGVADLLLTPLIDMFVILVVFLIMNFSANGELVNISKDITLPKAKTTSMLERAPVIQISPNTVAIEGFKVADTEELGRDADLRVPGLTEKLQEMRKVDEMMHPGMPFKGQIIINAHKEIDFKIIRKVMMASAEAGYTAINYAVNQAAKGAEGEAGAAAPTGG